MLLPANFGLDLLDPPAWAGPTQGSTALSLSQEGSKPSPALHLGQKWGLRLSVVCNSGSGKAASLAGATILTAACPPAAGVTHPPRALVQIPRITTVSEDQSLLLALLQIACLYHLPIFHWSFCLFLVDKKEFLVRSLY